MEQIKIVKIETQKQIKSNYKRYKNGNSSRDKQMTKQI